MAPIIEKLKRRAINRIPMKVCMMGPRAVGKTTILTSIFTDSRENLGAMTNLSLRGIGETDSELTNRKRYLDSVFQYRQQITDRPPAGLVASSKVNTFDFVFGVKDKEPRIDLEIKDFPGEFVQDRPDEVKKFINDSMAIFVAIDTPHLMEEDGAFCDVKNKPSIITGFFKDLLEKIVADDKEKKEQDKERLVLLIPLKCERYFYEQRMEDVLERVESVYDELIGTFKRNGKIACAVTPILTLGGVEYDTMKKENGQVVLNEYGCPEEVLYKFYGEQPKYNPAFCAQPLYYMLSFLSAQYERAKKNRTIWDRFLSSVFNLFDSDVDLFNEIKRMEMFRKTDLPGYRVECGGELFKYV